MMEVHYTWISIFCITYTKVKIEYTSIPFLIIFLEEGSSAIHWYLIWINMAIKILSASLLHIFKICTVSDSVSKLSHGIRISWGSSIDKHLRRQIKCALYDLCVRIFKIIKIFTWDVDPSYFDKKYYFHINCCYEYFCWFFARR